MLYPLAMWLRVMFTDEVAHAWWGTMMEKFTWTVALISTEVVSTGAAFQTDASEP